jgi:hypothetical protein
MSELFPARGTRQSQSDELTDTDIAQIERIFGNFNRVYQLRPEFFSAWLSLIESSGFQIPFSQIAGASTFTAQFATTITTSETLTSSTPGDLTTPGPTLTGLGPGTYAVFWGCDSSTAATTTQAQMFVFYGGSSIGYGAIQQATTTASVMKFAPVTITGSSDSLTAKYASSDNATTATFANRTLLALKFANA